jgi:hypothetical protein
MVLRAGFNAFIAFIVMTIAVFPVARLFGIQHDIPLFLAGGISGCAVIIGISIIQKKTLNLKTHALVVQSVITAIIALIFLAALVLPPRS